LGTTLQRVVPDGYLISADVQIMPPCPSGESFDRRHAHAGVLSLAADTS